MDNLIIYEKGEPMLNLEVANNILAIEKKMRELKEIQDENKRLLKDAMLEKGILKIQNEILGLSVTLVEEQTNLEKFDKAGFKKENPDLYDKYISFTGKKQAYITIRTK